MIAELSVERFVWCEFIIMMVTAIANADLKTHDVNSIGHPLNQVE